MHVHSYSKEDFGYLVAFQEGAIGLYSDEAASLCDRGADSDTLAPYKLTRLEITPDFHLHAPLVVWLEVTSRCNLKCRHCFVSASSLGEPPADELSIDQMLSLLDELKRQNVLCIVFTGGEPFVRSDFIRILEHATQLGFVIAVVSNGLRLTESLVKRIPKGNIRITISLDNLHLGEADDATNSRRFRYLQSRLLLLQRQGIACHAAATMTRKNLRSLKTIFSWLTEQGIGYREIPFSAIGRGAACTPRNRNSRSTNATISPLRWFTWRAPVKAPVSWPTSPRTAMSILAPFRSAPAPSSWATSPRRRSRTSGRIPPKTFADCRAGTISRIARTARYRAATISAPTAVLPCRCNVTARPAAAAPRLTTEPACSIEPSTWPTCAI